MKACRRQSAIVCQAESDKVKRRKAFGEWLLETDDPNVLPEPAEKDFWEGSRFDVIGKTAGFAVPVLIVLGVLIGLFAASGYNGGATRVVQPPTSAEDNARIVPNPFSD